MGAQGTRGAHTPARQPVSAAEKRRNGVDPQAVRDRLIARRQRRTERVQLVQVGGGGVISVEFGAHDQRQLAARLARRRRVGFTEHLRKAKRRCKNHVALLQLRQKSAPGLTLDRRQQTVMQRLAVGIGRSSRRQVCAAAHGRQVDDSQRKAERPFKSRHRRNRDIARRTERQGAHARVGGRSVPEGHLGRFNGGKAHGRV